jgi:glycosyltransferase involved in cell wall biosynthesis
MEKMRFSVLMSLYIREQADFLDRCLKSLKDQTLQADEIVIILDGPITDELNCTLKKWNKQLPLKIFPQQNNQGLGKALNVGIRECKHELIFRMDTDDICTADRFEKQYKYLDEHPEVDILSCSIKEFCSEPNDLKQIRKPPNKEKIARYIAIKNPMNHMGVVYKKSKILSSGSYQDLESMEDYYLWLRCFANNQKLDNIQEVLVHARVGNGMLERRKGKSYANSEWILHKYKLELLSSENRLKLWLIFVLRFIPRLLPKSILKALYKTTRL